jgi:hypothetical protein
MSPTEPSDDIADLREQVRTQLLKPNPAPLRMWVLVLAASLAAASLAMQLVRQVDTSALAAKLLADPAFKDTATAAMQVAAPVGSVIAWPVDSARLPEGWHICDGTELPAEDYPALTNVLKATYGKVEPGKVKLPDFRGCFLRGMGGYSAGLGDLQLDRVGSHKHPISWHYVEAAGRQPGNHNTAASLLTEPPLDRTAESNANHIPPPTDDETRPRNYAVHWVMRVR